MNTVSEVATTTPGGKGKGAIVSAAAKLQAATNDDTGDTTNMTVPSTTSQWAQTRRSPNAA